jgi:GT2 family glycosyltransferase/glycosyltransferase involved in cell wall biosynthesis
MSTAAAPMPTVTVVVVNLDGKAMLRACLESLEGQAYDPEQVEVVLIDNASTDGSVAMVRERFPRVRVLVNDTNTGFAPAVNQGAEVAGGEYLALLNNDAVADPLWLAEAVQYLRGHEEVGCVGSLILSDDRTTVDYAGSAMAFNGMGYALHNSEPARQAPGYAERTLFASGGAMVTPTALFRQVGGFDASYFAFFEDVDYGWRLWVLGHETHYVPASRVYHRHHGTMARFGGARERFLLERNALATIIKNYGEEALATALPSAVLLSMARAVTDLGDHPLPDFRITAGAQDLDGTPIPVSAHTAAHLAAIRDLSRMLPDLVAKRAEVQARRVTPDATIIPLFRKAMSPNLAGPEYVETFEAVDAAFGLTEAFEKPARVLIITGDHLSPRMAGPAIRSYEMATALLEAGMEVVLASTRAPEIGGRTIGGRSFDVTHVGPPGALPALLDQTDVVIFQGFVMHALPEIEHFDGAVVVDVYDPFHLENMTARKHELEWMRYTTHNSDTDVLNRQIQRGDFFVCASEKQRDFWLGQMSAQKRINPATFDDDESLRSLIDVAPFGIPGGPPVKTLDRAIRGVVEGIGDDDFLLLWGGGIYNWFDPLTLIDAVAQVVATHPEVKLFFMGSAHPNPEIPRMAMASSAYRLAEQHGLLGTHVFFNDGWVEYGHRQSYLMEADVGVSTHFEHLETRYSFRTRILDYIWCELPILATEGDTLSALAVERGLGLAVPPEDVDACAAAILQLLEDRELHARCVENLRAIKPEMTWSCHNPRRAADAQSTRKRYISGAAVPPLPPRTAGGYAKRFVDAARTEGPATAVQYARNIVRDRLRS